MGLGERLGERRGGRAKRLIHRTDMCDTQTMKGSEFLHRVHLLARRKKLQYAFVPARGKGSHGTVYFGTAFTTVKDRKKEIGAGLLRAMCKDLGIDPHEL